MKEFWVLDENQRVIDQGPFTQAMDTCIVNGKRGYEIFDYRAQKVVYVHDPENKNRVTAGKCFGCGRPSVRLLEEPPFIRATSLKHILLVYGALEPGLLLQGYYGYHVSEWGRYKVYQVDGEFLVFPFLSGTGYCWRCWAHQALNPKIRKLVINMPPEMVWPDKKQWFMPEWVSIGREPCRQGWKGDGELPYPLHPNVFNGRESSQARTGQEGRKVEYGSLDVS